MPSYVTPKKNTAYIFYLSLVDQADTKNLKANPTIAAGDFKVSIDGGSLTNLTTLPTVTPAGGVMVKVQLSTSEMNGDNITVVAVDAAGAEWCAQTINIQTSARQIDDLAFPLTSGRGSLVGSSGHHALDFAAINAPSGNSAISTGILWRGVLSSIANGSVTLPGGHGLDHAGNYAIVLEGGSNAIGKSRFLAYSGSGEVFNVDPAWNSDGETLPSGGITAYIVPAPKLPTGSVPNVNAIQVGSTPQTGVDLGADTTNIKSRLPAALTTNGNMKSSLMEILTTALTETAGQLAGGFKKFFNIASPQSTMDALTAVTTAVNLTNAPTNGDLTAAMKTSVVNGVLDASAGAHVTSGSIGKAINDASAASSPATIAAAVADQTLLGHTNPGTMGAGIAAAGAAADPLASAVPGAYVPGTAGYLIGTNLNASVSSRSSGGVGASGDTYALLTGPDPEPTSTPAANASPIQKNAYTFAHMRNKKLSSAGVQHLRNDADTADISSSTISDTGAGGTTTRGKW